MESNKCFCGQEFDRHKKEECYAEYSQFDEVFKNGGNLGLTVSENTITVIDGILIKLNRDRFGRLRPRIVTGKQIGRAHV